MKLRGISQAVATGLVAFSTALATPQSTGATDSVAVPSVRASAVPNASREMVREIVDPATGDRWILERDARHQGGPGRLVLVHDEGLSSELRASLKATAPMIHAGESLIVEEHSRLLDATLAATAISTAHKGDILRVRLMIGGRVVKAVAVAPGRAFLLPDQGEQQ